MKRLIPFEKYEATGNDFIIFDFFDFQWFDLKDSNTIQKMCDRHFGIGADGLIALERDPSSDFFMRYFNSDGRMSSFCGNGSRASLLYMYHKHNLDTFGFNAFDGAHKGLIRNGEISVMMNSISNFLPCNEHAFVHSGSPHLLVHVTDPFSMDVKNEGSILRNTMGPEGVNVNFYHDEGSLIHLSTFERGVENETLSCGTGITATAYYVNVVKNSHGRISQRVKVKGGELKVDMDLKDSEATNIWLNGPARRVFSGFIELD